MVRCFFWTVFRWQFNTDLQGHLLLLWSIFWNVRLQLFSRHFLGETVVRARFNAINLSKRTGWNVFSDPGFNPLSRPPYFSAFSVFFAITVVVAPVIDSICFPQQDQVVEKTVESVQQHRTNQEIHPPWQMDGWSLLVSFWDGPCSGAMLVSGSVYL